jgi:hypothetical protein
LLRWTGQQLQRNIFVDPAGRRRTNQLSKIIQVTGVQGGRVTKLVDEI